MSTIDINGVTVYVSAIESVADGVSHTYDRLWDRCVHEMMSLSWSAAYDTLEAVNEAQEKIVFPKQADHPAVIVKLTSGREFRIVGKTRKEVEEEIRWAKRRDRA
jgi:hypothetical protein